VTNSTCEFSTRYRP